jgi:CHAD domain-containing protein
VPYRLQADETVPEGIKRIVLRESESAIARLQDSGGRKRDEAIHEARKSVKKIRAAMRLSQKELGRTYREENERLCRIGRQLSTLRDAQALIEVFSGLAQAYKKQMNEETVASVRRGLERNKRETEASIDIEKLASRTSTALRSLSKRAKAWPLKSDGFGAIDLGLKARYRRGRKAMTAARQHPAAKNYHEWRKRVKDHWYHVRLIESVWTEMMQAREASLHQLESCLGDDHNLVVLCDKLRVDPEKFGGGENVRLCLALAEKRQQELRENALSLGERIYERKPADFIRDVSNLWHSWQAKPKGMNSVQKLQPKIA